MTSSKVAPSRLHMNWLQTPTLPGSRSACNSSSLTWNSQRRGFASANFGCRLLVQLKRPFGHDTRGRDGPRWQTNGSVLLNIKSWLDERSEGPTCLGFLNGGKPSGNGPKWSLVAAVCRILAYVCWWRKFNATSCRAVRCCGSRQVANTCEHPVPGFSQQRLKDFGSRVTNQGTEEVVANEVIFRTIADGPNRPLLDHRWARSRTAARVTVAVMRFSVL